MTGSRRARAHDGRPPASGPHAAADVPSWTRSTEALAPTFWSTQSQRRRGSTTTNPLMCRLSAFPEDAVRIADRACGGPTRVLINNNASARMATPR